ncbi:unnamed protein product [Adineta steineri]|uniref:Uncharacterized protein n=1 Tax=Adineta steineri TaxID=433720 RepID=A0A813VX22_9BILA|nr:unnamed protein product [Adineta steineri]
MEDNDVEDTSPSSSHPFFGRSGFPFVFLPSTLTGGFNFMNNHTHVSSVDDQSTTKKENDENIEEEEEEEKTEINGNDDGDRKDENDESIDEKSNLRISQPKYSQLLKELDFSQTRMVDVTNLLPNELDQQDTQSIQDKNDNESQKQTTDDEKYQSLSSARSSLTSDDDDDDGSNAQTYNNNNETDENKSKENENFTNAVNDIQNDLKNLTSIINEVSTDKNKHEEEDRSSQKKPTFDEEDDTSRQATQDYDLHENEQENVVSSSKSNQIHHIENQHSNDLQNKNKSPISQLDTDTNTQTESQKQDKDDEEKEQQQEQLVFINWQNLMYGNEDITQPINIIEPHEPIIETPKKPQQSLLSSDEESKPRTSSHLKQKMVLRPRPIIPSSSSSSDTDSIVEYALHRPKDKQTASSVLKQQIPPQTLRQDSQATLIDENLDELNSQLKHIPFDHEPQHIFSTSNVKEERTTDRNGASSFRILIPDILSTTFPDNDTPNRTNEHLLRHISNQRINYNPQRNRHTFHAPERSSSQRKKPSHHQHQPQQKYSSSRHIDRTEEITPRDSNDDWLTMLEKLEHEHKTRIEQQRKQYEDYMHGLEEKMKRRYDDYLTLTNNSQESKSDDYDNTTHAYHAHTSMPTDSNIGKYKSHSYNQTYRPTATDLVSHYYPADSTLNVLTSEKRRSTISDSVPLAESREDITNLRTHLSARHARQVDDLKLRYEYEINDLKSQLNRTKLGNISSTTRQSIGTIERINNENIRLRDELNGLRHSLKVAEDENAVFKRQLEELREQINHKDLDLKNYHRTVADLERQSNEAANTKERQNEKLRHADRQASLYREENEKLKIDLNRTRERLLRLEERSREQENENETLRRQMFLLENDNNRIKSRMTDDHKLNSSIPINVTSPREYTHFSIPTTVTRHSSSTISTPRDGIIDSGRYQSNDTGTVYHHTHTPRTITRISDYLNEKSPSNQSYVSPTKTFYSPKKSSPNRRRTESIPRRSSVDRQTKQTEQLEQKFDQLLKKKRDLETRLNRIPTRGLTNTDQQLYDVLEREIERVDQQIIGVKLDLRKSNTLRIH